VGRIEKLSYEELQQLMHLTTTHAVRSINHIFHKSLLYNVCVCVYIYIYIYDTHKHVYNIL